LPVRSKGAAARGVRGACAAPPLPCRLNGGGRRRVAMPDLGRDLQGSVKARRRYEVHLLGPKLPDLDLLGSAHHDGIPIRIEGRDVAWAGSRDPKPPSLANGVVRQSSMLSKHRPLPIHDRAGSEGVGSAPLEKPSVVVVRNETDLLALGLVGGDEAQGPGLGAHLLLGQFAHGKPCRGELGLAQRPQEVRLVLSRISAAPEQIPSRGAIVRDPRVVARRHSGRVPGARAMKQRAELDVAVAYHARHRRASGRVLAGEVRDHGLVELPLTVEEVVRDAEPARHLAGVVHGLRRAAAAELAGRFLRLPPRPDPQRDPDHLATLLEEQRCRDRRVHPAAHSDDDPLAHARQPVSDSTPSRT